MVIMRQRTGRWRAVPVINLIFLLLVVPVAAAELSHIGPAGFRMSHYRAPTPADVPHGITVDTDHLKRLIATENPVLIDVQAVVVRPETAEFGLSWLPNEPRYHIPGSTWLPNVGHGELEPMIERYFKTHLEYLTQNRKDQPIVIYCVLDCWMSWNAVQRAAEYGYKELYWYREGTDGWAEQGLPLVEGQPAPLQASHETFFAAINPANLQAELEIARSLQQKALLLFFETPVCPYCKRMKRDVLSRAEIQKQYRPDFRALALNSLSNDELIDLQGQKTTFKQFSSRGDNRVRVTPTIVFYGLNGHMLYRHVGIIADPSEFLLLGQYVSEDYYLRTSYAQYIRAQRQP